MQRLRMNFTLETTTHPRPREASTLHNLRKGHLAGVGTRPPAEPQEARDTVLSSTGHWQPGAPGSGFLSARANADGATETEERWGDTGGQRAPRAARELRQCPRARLTPWPRGLQKVALRCLSPLLPRHLHELPWVHARPRADGLRTDLGPRPHQTRSVLKAGVKFNLYLGPQHRGQYLVQNRQSANRYLLNAWTTSSPKNPRTPCNVNLRIYSLIC